MYVFVYVCVCLCVTVIRVWCGVCVCMCCVGACMHGGLGSGKGQMLSLCGFVWDSGPALPPDSGGPGALTVHVCALQLPASLCQIRQVLTF